MLGYLFLTYENEGSYDIEIWMVQNYSNSRGKNKVRGIIKAIVWETPEECTS